MNGIERSELNAVQAELRSLTSSVDKLVTRFDASETRGVDHETRIRGLERYKAAFPLSTVITVAVLAIGLFGILQKG